MINRQIFFIGLGNMAGALVKGIIESGAAKRENIFFNEVIAEGFTPKNEYGLEFITKQEGAKKADIIVLAVKPNNVADVLEEIKACLKKGALIISIAAGISSKFIEEKLGTNAAVIRTMPNTPASVLAGATALCKGSFASDADLSVAKNLFLSAGAVEVVAEEMIDAVTALSGSGPAYVFYLCELMQQAAQNLGLPESVASKFAVQTIYGAGKMLAETGVPASTLRQNVTSPNGTTQAALEYFKTQNLAGIVQKAMESAARRSKELSK